MPFLLLIAVIAIVIHLIRKRTSRRRAISLPPDQPDCMYPFCLGLPFP